MSRLLTQLELLQEEKRTAARLGCLHIEALLDDLTPANLDELQHGLRMGLLDVEHRIREWKVYTSAPERDARITRYRRRYGPSARIGEHLRNCDILAQELNQLRAIMRQIGDGIAWSILRSDARIIRPLFAKRTHFLSEGLGLVGPVQLIVSAHEVGQFLVIDNDITRCLGVGDITIVRAGKPWAYPLSVEIKTTGADGELTEGTSVNINCSAVLTAHPDQRALHREFGSALGFNEGTLGLGPRESLERQSAEMMQRAQLLVGLTQPRASLPRRRTYWPTIETVISRAQSTGVAFDEPERGLIYAAIRLQAGEDTERMMLHLLDRLQQHIPRGEPLLTTADFKDRDEYAAMVPPIALWRLPTMQRAALLAGDVLLGCVFRRDVFDAALQSVGLNLSSDSHEGWTINPAEARGSTEGIRFDRLEVAKLRLGIAFNAMSPRELAEVCAEHIFGLG